MNLLYDRLTFLTFDIFKALVNNTEENFLFSPVSYLNVLGMLQSGADNETKNQLGKILNYEKEYDKFYEDLKDLNSNLFRPNEKTGESYFKSNNMFFYNQRKRVNAAFYDKLVDDFDYISLAVNSNSKIDSLSQIREHLGFLTDKKDLTEKLDSSSLFVNSILFDALWAVPFSSETTEEDFINGDKKIRVPMMKTTGNFKYGQSEKYEALQMDYQDNGYSFIALMSKNDSNLIDLLTNISEGQNFNELISNLKSSMVNVTFPKFNLQSLYDMLNDIKLENIQEAIKSNHFSEMFVSESVSSPEISQISTIFVSQDGTLASSVTQAIQYLEHSNVNDSIELKFNRPFMFFIVKNDSEDDLKAKKSYPVFAGMYSGKEF